MKKIGDYLVRFSEIKADFEYFNYQLKHKFFNLFKNPVWEDGNVEVELKATKRLDGITFDLEMKGFIDVVCDRCLDLYSQNIFVEQRIFLKYGDHDEELDDDIMVIARETNEFNLGQMFYDYLVLALPVKKVHPNLHDGTPGCNKLMLQKLEKYIISGEQKETDPRWNELKKIIDKN